MKYSIVIPTYNHCNDLLKPCIESIFKYSNIVDVELIVSANGCNDSTFEYLGSLKEKFSYLGLSDNIKIAWDDKPLGYAKATNAGVKLATTDFIVLLNNDILLLESPKNTWLEMLANEFTNEKCGISCVSKGFSDPAGRDFAIFFCVMIHRKVFDKIGLITEEFGVGGGEDTDFCIKAEDAGFEVIEVTPKEWSSGTNQYVGGFPIYHKGEGTVHDINLVPEWNKIFLENTLKLAKKYNPKWYQWRISNNAERGVFLKGDAVFARELTRYSYAAQHLVGTHVLEIGCSSGFGLQFLPENIVYTGIDYDQEIITCALEQEWRLFAGFTKTTIDDFIKGTAPNLNNFYDTIIAFETLEHVPNAPIVAEKLKHFCKKLIITVPFNENPGQFSPHHLSHNLTPDKFNGFKHIGFIDISGNIIPPEMINMLEPGIEYNLLMTWENTGIIPNQPKKIDRSNYKEELSWMKAQHEEIYREVIADNCYSVTEASLANREVIDIGANIGAFTVLAGYLGAKKVIGVEPISTSYGHLLNNVERAGLTNVVALKNIVSDVSGNFCDVSLNENSGHNSMYNVSERFETIETITLHEILAQLDSNNIMLKLDCEGAEYDILLKASLEDMNRISEVIVEIHSELHPVHKGFEIIDNKLLEFGFKQADAKQVFFWTYDQSGNLIDCKPIPFRIEIWKR